MGNRKGGRWVIGREMGNRKAGVPQPVAIIAIGEDANNLAITRRQQRPSWPSRISRVYDGARAASTRVMCTYV